jgi:hypothetical protein
MMPGFANFKVETAVSWLAIFSASAVLFGYVFQLGFLNCFDSRIFQFLTVQDYVITSATYIFVLPVSYLVFSLAGFSKFFDAHNTLSGLLKTLFQDEFEIGLEDQLKMLKAQRVFLIAALVALIVMVLTIIAAVMGYLSNHTIVPTICLFFYIAFGAIAGIFAAIRPTKSALQRQRVGFVFLVTLLFSFAYFYGQYCGLALQAVATNDVQIDLMNGHNIKGVLIRKYAEGIVYRLPSAGDVWFLPNEQIADVQLIAAR